MAIRRLERMGRAGEALVAGLTGGRLTARQAPFDVVDFSTSVAYEVKTVSHLALLGTNKIHIEAGAWARKEAFLAEWGLRGVLMVVVIFSEDHTEVFRTELKAHQRISSVVRLANRTS